MSNELELNKKLAKWVGFYFVTDDDEHLFDRYCAMQWIYPDGVQHKGMLPDFTSSLDACFKWLVPRLKEEGYLLSLRLLGSISGGWQAELGKGYFPYECCATARDEHPALALCRAIEQLVGKGPR